MVINLQFINIILLASKIRQFSKQNPVFGWDKFIQFNKLGQDHKTPIRFVALITFHDYPIQPQVADKYERIAYPNELYSFMLPESLCRDHIPFPSTLTGKPSEKKPEPMDLKQDFIMTEETRKKYILNLWNNGDPKCPTAIIQCGDQTFLIHDDILAQHSQVISQHFKNTDSFNPQPFVVSEEAIPQEFLFHVIQFCYTEQIPEKYSLKPITLEQLEDGLPNLNFGSFFTLYRISIHLKMHGLLSKLLENGMSVVRLKTLPIAFRWYKNAIASMEGGRIPTKLEFFE